MEILNTVVQQPGRCVFLTALLVIFAMVAAGTCTWLIYMIVEAIRDEDILYGVLSFFIAAVCVVGIIFCVRGVNALSDARETIVYATIDDSTPWSEINERYELIRQDGKIYQLRLREICQPEPDVV